MEEQTLITSRHHCPLRDAFSSPESPNAVLSSPSSFGSYSSGSGRFQRLYDYELLKQLDFKRHALELEREKKFPWPNKPPESLISEIAHLERCQRLFMEAKRALNENTLGNWIYKFSRLKKNPIALINETRKCLEELAFEDEERYGPAVRELPSNAYSNEIMDAVIIKIVKVQFGPEIARNLLDGHLHRTNGK